MTKKIARPKWYNDELYNKHRTPEEWLFELDKRYNFKRDKIGIPQPINKLPQSKQEYLFQEYIFSEEIESILDVLQPTSRQPIKYPSVSDIFIMYHSLINSDWYKSHPKRLTFENAFLKKLNNGILTGRQKDVLMEMHDTPWCVFHKDHEQENWCPNKDFHYLTGIPISLDAFHSKESICTDLKNKLTAWAGKPHDFLSKLETWHESKILAVFDLMTWLEIRQIKYTKIDLYELIWPKGRISKITGEVVEPNGAIKNSIKLADEVISPGYIKLLVMICEDRKLKNEREMVG
jgi:hypothetical protein